MRSILIGIALFLAIPLIAQEQLGLRLDNYAGINSALYNPAAPAAGALSWDVNIIGFGQFFDNNYGFIRNTGVFDLWRNADSDREFFFQRDVDTENIQTGDGYIYDYFTGNRTRYGIATTDVLGPSFFVRLGESTTIGLLTRVRVHGSAFGVDEDLSFYSYDSRLFGEQFPIDPAQTGAAAWSEVSLNIGRVFALPAGEFSIGISPKFLQGYEGVYFNSVNRSDFSKEPDRVIAARDIDLMGGYTDTWTADDYSPEVNGSGWGIDLGFSYAAAGDYGPYRWKLGLAILDLGQINFDQNAREYRFINPNLADLDGDDYQDYSEPQEVQELVDQFTRDVVDNPDEALIDDKFSLGLPTAISLQFDYAVAPRVFVAANYITGIPVTENRMERGQMLGVVPRWESRWLSFSLPVSIYEWQHFRVGAAARLGFLTLGSDHLSGLFGAQKFSGADGYIALKLTPLWGQNSKKERTRKRRSSQNRELPCYRW